MTYDVRCCLSLSEHARELAPTRAQNEACTGRGMANFKGDNIRIAVNHGVGSRCHDERMHSVLLHGGQLCGGNLCRTPR
jgi:hypothetical protein